MEDLIPHPSAPNHSLHDWLGAMVRFLVLYCPRCCDARDGQRWSNVEITAAGGNVNIFRSSRWVVESASSVFSSRFHIFRRLPAHALLCLDPCEGWSVAENS